MIEIIGSFKLVSKKVVEQTVTDCLNSFAINHNQIVEVVFADADKMRQLNLEHRQIDKATDVLSFPQSQTESAKDQILGSIIICEEMAQKYQESVEELVKHGFLHLMGYDHETDGKNWSIAENKLG